MPKRIKDDSQVFEKVKQKEVTKALRAAAGRKHPGWKAGFQKALIEGSKDLTAEFRKRQEENRSKLQKARKMADSYATAKRHLNEIACELKISDFKEGVFWVTMDSAIWMENVMIEAPPNKYGDWWFIWSEHHGDFLVHDSDVEIIRYWEM